ncbi:uncharacterized protein LOC123263860 [Cotesia glomerata]|uniref:Uncharacterized protein n=1 Tax=Cotesia glomerata TaxID=32391 RepID=A0AAV7IQE2_COTGL|nr:uncharacterized protein LOC123263860 [Cotesia glomerata]XP_044582831.1 uncharacterized protein LOC123263860 [Cotesia glomerata]KAH0555191.1 hypothetical protein KQX54_015944 [Cotesia glomerata]
MERNYPMTTRSRSENDRIVFYDNRNYYSERLPDFRDELISQGLYPPSPQLQNNRARRSNSVCTQSDRPKRFRSGETGNRRRNSIHGRITHGPTPLGDGRRASVKRKVSARRSNSINRKSSTRLSNTSKTYHYPPEEMINDDHKIKVVEKSLMELEQARKQRQIVIIILGIFVILVVTSVLIVIITLTRRSFRTSIATPLSLHHNYSARQNELKWHNASQSMTNTSIPP